MKLQDPVELLYLALMLRWEKSAPANGKQGLLDDEPERNTQISRMVYLLHKVEAGTIDKTFRVLALHSRRNDGESYISKNSSWMEEPRELFDGWYFEGCTSLIQKQEILQGLRKVGLSAAFVSCADDFVAGKSVLKYLPSEEEQNEIIARLKEQGENENT